MTVFADEGSSKALSWWAITESAASAGKPVSQTASSPMSAYEIMRCCIYIGFIFRVLGFGYQFDVVLYILRNFRRIPDSTRSVWAHLSLRFSRTRRYSKFPIGSIWSIASNIHSASLDVEPAPRGAVRLDILRWRAAAWVDRRWGEVENCVSGMLRCYSHIMMERHALETAMMKRTRNRLTY